MGRATVCPQPTGGVGGFTTGDRDGRPYLRTLLLNHWGLDGRATDPPADGQGTVARLSPTITPVYLQPLRPFAPQATGGVSSKLRQIRPMRLQQFVKAFCGGIIVGD